jgi:hypothetical protein
MVLLAARFRLAGGYDTWNSFGEIPRGRGADFLNTLIDFYAKGQKSERGRRPYQLCHFVSSEDC